jgi:DNA-binding CsgD family transcriptional regulator
MEGNHGGGAALSDTKRPGGPLRLGTEGEGTRVALEVTLSTRQAECLRRIACGETSIEIAVALQLSRHTVNHYIDEACHRLRAKTRAHAVAQALVQRLIAPPDC